MRIVGFTGKFGSRSVLLAALLLLLCPGSTRAAAASSIVAWGANWAGQSTSPTGLADVVSVSSGEYHNLALRSDGTVVAWGNNVHGETNVPAGLSGVVAISGGSGYSVALKNDGTVVAWGGNAYGQTDIPPGLSGVITIAASANGDHILAVRNDGTVVAWGRNTTGQTNVPAGLSHVVAVAAGEDHSLALKDDGTVVAWGWNAYGELNVPAGLTGVIAVSAGTIHSLALKSDGTVVGWGYNGSGEATPPAGLTGVVAISAGNGFSLARKIDGTVVAWGNTSEYGVNPIDLPPAARSGVLAVSAGFTSSVALVASDTATPTWGAPVTGVNGSGQATVTVTVQDPFNGLGIVRTLKATNCTIAVNLPTGGIYTTYPTTTGPVTVTATKVNQSQRASFTVLATDGAGNSATFDPLILALRIPHGSHSTSRVVQVPTTERYLSITGSDLGMRSLTAFGNGRRIRIPLSEASKATVDLGNAANSNTNCILLVADGPPGGTVAVMFGDTAGAGAIVRRVQFGGVNGDWGD